MSEPSRPATPPEPEPRPRANYANPGMRISDAERAEVSDRLSKHYSEGRLDEAEFSRRLDQAMHAVTQADLSGLFDDLPEDAAAGGRPGAGQAGRGRASQRVISPDQAGPASRRRTPLSRVLAVAVLIVIAGVVGSALSHLFFPWILIAVVAVLWLRRGSCRRSRPVPPQG
jgi:uncharacterized protein DUF1707